MGQSAAKQGDRVSATDTHIELVPSPGGPVPTPTPATFDGVVDAELASTVRVDHAPAAVDGSTASNTPPHVPKAGPFQTPPSNQGTIVVAARSVVFDGKRAARHGDPTRTCNDPVDLPVGTVAADSTVKVGD